MDSLITGAMPAHDGDKYLPQYTLDALYRQVIEPLSTFRRLSSETIWDTPSESCKQIEQNLRIIDTIIVTAKRKQSGCVSGTICYYHQMLARIYILLYYVHRDDEVFQNVIFPKLLRDMGPYGLSDFVKVHINRKIDNQLEQDRALVKAMLKQPATGVLPTVASAVVASDAPADVPAVRMPNGEEPLPVDQDTARTQNMKPTLTAGEAALLMMTVCHEIGGLPNDKKKLHPILTQCWGFTEQTASRALGMRPEQKTADHLAQVFENVSPKLARLIKEFPEKFEKLKLEKLKANNDKKVKKK